MTLADAVPLSLLLTLGKNSIAFSILIYCFYGELWACNLTVGWTNCFDLNTFHTEFPIADFRNISIKIITPINSLVLYMNKNIQFTGSSESAGNTYPQEKQNPFVPNASFFYPLKTSENFTVFWCFQGVEKGCIGNKWVKWKCRFKKIINNLSILFGNA